MLQWGSRAFSKADILLLVHLVFIVHFCANIVFLLPHVTVLFVDFVFNLPHLNPPPPPPVPRYSAAELQLWCNAEW